MNMTDLWTTAGDEAAADDLNRRVVTAREALSSTIAFILKAGSRDDFNTRRELADDIILKAAVDVAEEDMETLENVLAELDEGMEDEYELAEEQEIESVASLSDHFGHNGEFISIDPETGDYYPEGERFYCYDCDGFITAARKTANIEVEMCVDCLMLVANGEVPEGNPTFLEDFGRINEGYHVVPGDGEGWFSWSACDTCGSRLGGDRYQGFLIESSKRAAFTEVEPRDDDTPTEGECSRCGNFVGTGDEDNDDTFGTHMSWTPYWRDESGSKFCEDCVYELDPRYSKKQGASWQEIMDYPDWGAAYQAGADAFARGEARIPPQAPADWPVGGDYSSYAESWLTGFDEANLAVCAFCGGEANGTGMCGNCTFTAGKTAADDLDPRFWDEMELWFEKWMSVETVDGAFNVHHYNIEDGVVGDMIKSFPTYDLARRHFLGKAAANVVNVSPDTDQGSPVLRVTKQDERGYFMETVMLESDEDVQRELEFFRNQGVPVIGRKTAGGTWKLHITDPLWEGENIYYFDTKDDIQRAQLAMILHGPVSSYEITDPDGVTTKGDVVASKTADGYWGDRTLEDALAPYDGYVDDFSDLVDFYGDEAEAQADLRERFVRRDSGGTVMAAATGEPWAGISAGEFDLYFREQARNFTEETDEDSKADILDELVEMVEWGESQGGMYAMTVRDRSWLASKLADVTEAEVFALNTCNACEWRQVETPNDMGYCDACLEEIGFFIQTRGAKTASFYLTNWDSAYAGYQGFGPFDTEAEAEAKREELRGYWGATVDSWQVGPKSPAEINLELYQNDVRRPDWEQQLAGVASKLGSTRYETAQRVIQNRQAEQLEGHLLDLQTAQVLVAVYEALNPDLQAQFDSPDLMKLVEMGWRNVARKVARR